MKNRLLNTRLSRRTVLQGGASLAASAAVLSGLGKPAAAQSGGKVIIGARHFGSAHPGGCNVVHCDASVRMIRYGVSPTVFRQFVDRKDGEAFSSSDL